MPTTFVVFIIAVMVFIAAALGSWYFDRKEQRTASNVMSWLGVVSLLFGIGAIVLVLWQAWSPWELVRK